MDQDRLWQAVLGDVEISLSRGNYMTWFKNTQLLKREGDTFTVGVPNIFIKGQLETRYNDLLIETLRKHGVATPVIIYKIHSGAVRKDAGNDIVTLSTLPQSAAPAPAIANTLAHSYRQGINERYTFETFVVGSGNELAYAACQAVATTPGTKYNPLFLYGGAGIGKTHLMQAVGNAVLHARPDAKVVYISSEQFLQEFVDSLRFKKISDFTNHYRSADVLIVDDIQFIAGKEKAQEEFFHTFNALHQAEKQIIISSDKPPHEIPGLEDRMRSRFAWGMSIDMQNPDFETRCAILKLKADSRGMHLPADVVDYLATNVSTNIRELEGALNQLIAFCELHGVDPNLAIATGQLSGLQNRPRHLSARQIIERCAKYFQVSVEDMLSPKRDKEIVVPRQIAMYMLRAELHLSFPKIARELGRKDHTTAIHSVEKVTAESQFDSEVRTALAEIKEKLYA